MLVVLMSFGARFPAVCHLFSRRHCGIIVGGLNVVLRFLLICRLVIDILLSLRRLPREPLLLGLDVMPVDADGSLLAEGLHLFHVGVLVPWIDDMVDEGRDSKPHRRQINRY